METEEKIRVLALGDYGCTTGFATVMSNIMQQLNSTGKYAIDVVAINYTGDPLDPEKFPGRVFPAMTIANMNQGDPYGRQKFLDMLGSGEYDVAFIIQDTFIVQTMIDAIRQTQSVLPKKFKLIYYFPIDAAPKREWVEKCVALADFPVVYTHYGEELVLDIDPSLKSRLSVIYHGTNLADFKYIENRKEVANFRHNYFAGKADGKFLITNVNRNQVRKDPMRNFMILNELRKRGRKDAILYLHMSHDDAGGNLLVMGDHFGFKLQEDYIIPSPRFFNENQGIPTEALNLIYNCSDALLTPTLGEGWGLSLTEAMATKLPVVAPANTSVKEILADNRGYLTRSGANPSMWYMLGSNDNERLRPLMDVEDAANNLEKIMDGILPDIDKAYAWASQYNWEAICQEWQAIFDKAAAEAKVATRVGVAQPNRAQRRKLKAKKH